MTTVREAIGNFLRAQEHNNPSLIARYNEEMEVQVNVSARGGEAVEGKRNTYTDGQFTWNNIRIPRKANTVPEWRDYELQWPLDYYAEGIGMTGHNWVKRISVFTGYDFDSISGHAIGVGIADEQLEIVKQKAMGLDYVETLKSTGGGGIHLYVPLPNVPTANHTEHAALARCVLAKMSSDCGFDFAAQVDACGGVMWCWHRKMTRQNEGLKLLKPAVKPLTMDDLPPNWKDHIEVIKKTRSKIRLSGIPQEEADAFDALTSGRNFVPLDDTHRAIEKEVCKLGYSWIWVPDHHMVQTHTVALQDVLDKQRSVLKLKGCFATNSEGRDPGTPNCFMFPMENGGFRVYRFNKGIVEAKTWRQDGSGWTSCDYNTTPDLNTASAAAGGTECPNNGGFSFTDLASAARVVQALGQSIDVPAAIAHRTTVLKKNSDGRLVVEVERTKEDPNIVGWDKSKRGVWRQVVSVRVDAGEDDIEFDKFDKVMRCLVTPAGDRAGWIGKSLNGEWIRQPKDDLRSILSAFGKSRPEGDQILGLAAVRHWTLVNLPFQNEYPGDRRWNREAAQYRFKPADLEDESPVHPHWDLILNHIGDDLTEAIKELEWCKQANILTGADYLRHWIACLLREPFEPLPYLFFFGPQNSGKSIFHEAISLLITSGCVAADRAITNAAEFNGELANAILCYIEEKNISHSAAAYNRIKEWVTAKTLSVRKMRTDSYSQPNTTHWIQCANKQENCPVFPGDTRITVIYVGEIVDEIPKKYFIQKLEEEAPHFMRTMLDLELAKVQSRLRLPVVTTKRKQHSQSLQRSSLECFIDEQCYISPGATTPFKDFYDAFLASMDGNEQFEWSKRKVSMQLPERLPTGRSTNNKVIIGNLSLTPVEEKPNANWLIRVDDKLQEDRE
jgi:hypothetical protein